MLPSAASISSNLIHYPTRSAWLMLLLVPLLLAGCGEVLNEYYISNHTNAELKVRFTPYYVETVDVRSGLLNPDIQRGVRSSLSQSVQVEQVGNILHFTVPAQTSVYLGSSSGGNDLFSELEIDMETQQLAINEGNIKQYFTVYDVLVGPVVHVLNIK